MQGGKLLVGPNLLGFRPPCHPPTVGNTQDLLHEIPDVDENPMILKILDDEFPVVAAAVFTGAIGVKILLLRDRRALEGWGWEWIRRRVGTFVEAFWEEILRSKPGHPRWRAWVDTGTGRMAWVENADSSRGCPHHRESVYIGGRVDRSQ